MGLLLGGDVTMPHSSHYCRLPACILCEGFVLNTSYFTFFVSSIKLCDYGNNVNAVQCTTAWALMLYIPLSFDIHTTWELYLCIHE